MRSLYLAILVAFSGAQLLAQSNGLSVPPWFSPNSVIQEVNRDAVKVRQLLLSVRSRIPVEIEVTSPLWSGRRIQLERAQAQTLSEWSTWELGNSDLRSGQLARLVPGVPFELVITPAGKGPEELRLTNMVMGQVWLLAVSPDRDSHEMPQLSASALEWIRVLPLEGMEWTSMTGRWDVRPRGGKKK